MSCYNKVRSCFQPSEGKYSVLILSVNRSCCGQLKYIWRPAVNIEWLDIQNQRMPLPVIYQTELYLITSWNESINAALLAGWNPGYSMLGLPRPSEIKCDQLGELSPVGGCRASGDWVSPAPACLPLFPPPATRLSTRHCLASTFVCELGFSSGCVLVRPQASQ